MKRSRVFVVAGVALLFLVGSLAVVIAGLGKLTVPGTGATELTYGRSAPISVQTASVRLGPIESALPYSGNIKPKDEVQVLPKVSGRLLELNVDVGDSVSKGDVIARIDTDSVSTQLLQANAALQIAEAKLSQVEEGARVEQIAQAEAAVAAAQARLDRLQAPLNANEIDIAKAAEVSARAALDQAQAAYDNIAWYDGKGMLPQSMALQQATTAYEAAKAAYEEKLAGAKPEDIRAQEAAVAQVQAALALAKAPYRTSDYKVAHAGVAQAEAAVHAAELQLAECTVKSPIDGVIADSPLTVGAIVGPSTPIARVVSSETEITIKVEEAAISAVKEGQPATIHLAAYPDIEFTGTVTRIHPTADASDRTFQIRIEPDASNDELRAGMFAEVNLITEKYANALLVPSGAIVTQSDRTFVFVVANDEAERREVKLGLTQGTTVQVLSGVVSGERVVTSGQSILRDQELVTVAAAS